ncbi:MAG: hypothetical protein AAF570_08885, partial [Bacteroidota bacterium]
MQPKKKLKVIPIYRFFQAMDLGSKAVFLLVFVPLLALSVASVIAVEDPVQWSLEVNEYPVSTEQEVGLREYNAH